MSRTSRTVLLLLALLAPLLPLGLPTAGAADCARLGPEDFTYGSTLTGHLDAKGASACYVLDLPTGARIGFGRSSGDPDVRLSGVPTGGGSTTTRSCPLATLSPCAIQPATTYTVRVVAPTGPFDYAVPVLRLDGATGCPAYAPGSPDGTGAPLTGTLPPEGFTCRTVTIPGGRTVLGSTGRGIVQMFGADAGQECQPDVAGACTVDAGEQTLVVATGEGSGGTYSVRVVPLGASASCAVASTSWFAAARAVATDADGGFGCATLDETSTGDGVLTAVDQDAGSAVVDAGGQDVCSGGGRICRLTGTAPFRIVTWSRSAAASTLHVTARKVGPTSDCPVVEPLHFGQAPADDHGGVSCRRFTAVSGHLYSVRRLYGGGRYLNWVDVFDSRFAERTSCQSGPCDLGSGDVTVLTESPADAEPFRTLLYDTSRAEGCSSPALGGRAHPISFSTGVWTCETVDVAAGTQVTRATQMPLGTTLRNTWVDAGGRRVGCGGNVASGPQLDGPCTLTGPGPYRLLTWTDREWAGLGTTVTPSRPGGCPTLAAGLAHPVRRTLGSDVVVACYRLPVRPGASQAVFIDSDRSVTAAVADDGTECSDLSSDGCAYDEAHPVRRLLVVARPGTTFRLLNANTLKGPVNWVPPRIRRATVLHAGDIAEGSQGAWAGASEIRTAWLIDGRAVPNQSSNQLIVPSNARGKLVQYRATAVGHGVHRVVVSAPVRVAVR